MRKIPEKLRGEPPAIPAPKPAPGLCEDVLKLKLATPMVGGGVKAGDVDRDRPIRASSIRGHLRYWWRLLCANGLKGDRLREAEGAIWGSTETPSKVTLLISALKGLDMRKEDYKPKNSDTYSPFEFGPSSAEAYALFPVAPKIKRRQIAEGDHGKDIAREGLAFTVTLTYPEEARDQVRMALAAWIYFGGVGARTRRGCGSLHCEEARLSGGGALPSLSDVLAANSDISLWRHYEPTTSMAAWKRALEVYKEYRQQRPKDGNRFGRSRWPEPDSLRMRNFSGRSSPEHREAITSPLPSFPRAALGLPIIFHFMTPGDPKDVTLTAKWGGNAVTRMASPIITKPVYDNGRWYPAVILLPHADALKIAPITGLKGDPDIIGVKDQRYVKAKYQPTQGKDNAIDGFIEFISNPNKKFSKFK